MTRVDRTELYFLLREVCKSAATLVESSDAMSESTSLVETPHLTALRRALDDLVSMGALHENAR